MASGRIGVSRTAINDGDRQLRRTAARFGEEFREIRLRAGISQAALARAIGVSRSVVCRMEMGNPEVSARTRARAVTALGGDFRIAVYPGDAPLIHDAAHASIVEAVLRVCAPSWHPTLESPVPGPGRRSTDIRIDRIDRLDPLAHLDGQADIILMEVETHVRAFEGIIRACAEKRAAVAGAIHAAAGRPTGALEAAAGPRIHVVLVLPPTRHHRTLVSAHPGIVAAAFPASHDSLAHALANPDVPWPGDGILWMSGR